MKITIKLAFLAVAGLLFFGSSVQAQAKKKKAPPKKVNTKSPTAKLVADTTSPVIAAVPAPAVVERDSIPLKSVDISKRPNSSVQGDLIKDKRPLDYDHIRIDDQVYKQIVWREIDLREKMNQPFKYEAEDDNGSQKFFNILLKQIKDGEVTAFSNVNDRFTAPLKVEEIATMLAGKKYTMSIPDLVRDPDLSKGLTKDTTIRDDFDERTITAYRLKEEWIFDRETSRLIVRIMGIAPVKSVFEADGSLRDSYPLFWLYYPDLRPSLSKYEAYNPRNYGARMSWEEIFETRYFASYIYKSTLNNPFDKPLAGILADPLMRLLEGENIKDQIFNWEQDQWSY